MPVTRVSDFDLNYETAGEGTALVLLHGLGASLEDWEYQIAEFSRDYRVIAPDLRGFGRSGRGKLPMSVELLAQDVWQFLQQLGLRQFYLAGHSMGGAVAQQLALDHPDAVKRMVIANSVPSFQPREFRQKFEIWYRLIVIRLLGSRRLGQIGAARMYPGPELAALREKVIARSADNRIGSYTQALLALTRWSVLARLHELKMPVMVLASEHDYFSRGDELTFAHALPKGRFHFFAGRHHGLPLEAPQDCNPVIRKFLRSR